MAGLVVLITHRMYVFFFFFFFYPIITEMNQDSSMQANLCS